MYKKWVIRIVISCCVVFDLLALDPGKAVTQYIIDGWTVDQGLPQSSVRPLLQTSDGYLWVGTQDGLARFDGVEFTVFDENNTPAITKNHIFCLFEDSQKKLWIGTLGGGVVVYQKGKFKSFTETVGLSSNYIHCIYEDSSGNIWIGTDGGGMNQWDEATNTFKVYNRDSDLQHNVVRAICGDAERNLWIGTGKGLCCYKNGRFKGFPKGDAPGPGDEFVNTIYEDRQKNLWIGTDKGIYLERDGQFIRHNIKIDSSIIDVKCIFEDSDGNLWIGTENSGLIRYCNGKTAVLTQKDGLLANMVLGITGDREGSLWVGTAYGLNRLKEGKFTTITTKEGLSNDVVFSLFEDSKGYLWIGTENGLNRYKDGKFMHFTSAHGLSHPSLATTYEDSKGFIWVGTDGGLNQLRNSPQQISVINSYLSGEYIPAIIEDRVGDIWVGILSGAIKIKGGKLQQLTEKDGLGSESVSCFYKDSQGDLWLSTYRKGITRYKDGKFTVLGKEDGLSGDTVHCIYEDSENVLWLGTNNGLSRLKDGKFSIFTKRDGLFHNNIYHILEDRNSNLWMSTNKGIFRVRKQDLHDFAEDRIDHIGSVVYGKDDGMRTKECVGGNQTTGCKTRDGKLWFPTLQGVVFIDPRNIRINRVLPPVIIEQVLLDGKPVDPGQQVVVPPEIKRLEIFYTALSFVNPASVKFKYQLEGYDQQWIDDDKYRKALYTNLDPGHYGFKVIACNDDGLWNETGASIGIKVIPPYWKTWWFRVIAVIVFAVLSYLIIHFSRKYLTLAAFWKKQKYIGNFKLLEIIGSGGMGTIYKAQSLLEKSKTVALKVLREEMFMDESSRKRFKQEAAIIDQLDHPNIVKVIERGEAKQNLFIAMEYLQGKTLTQKIKQEKKLDIKEAIHIMVQIADALAKIHRKNIIHRDLKPDNIMLVERKGDPNFVKLLDFGLAKTQYQTRLTQTGVVIGTINYLGPEQISGKGASSASDVYSLGILFYEMLTGEKPFIGETTIDIMKQIMDKTPIEPLRFRDDIPRELNHLIMKMLGKDKKSRPIIYDVVTYLKTIAYTLR